MAAFSRIFKLSGDFVHTFSRRFRHFPPGRGLLRCQINLPVINFQSSVTSRAGRENSKGVLRKSLLLLGAAFGSFCGFRLYDRLKSALPVSRTIQAGVALDIDSILELPKQSGSKSRNFNFVADVVEMIASAVVHIEGLGRGQTILEHLMVPSSSGSGFLVTDGGLVLTNAHVVKNMRIVNVMLADGSTMSGDVVSLDEASDLAAIQLKNTNERRFNTIKLGDSSTIRPGEFVVAMGSPLRLSNTVTSGIVSTVHRAAEDLHVNRCLPQIQYIQTDAAINVGNSGGPLVNLDGEVIGINSMTVKGAVGISFAIPVNTVREFLRMTAKKRLLGTPSSRGYIGINMLTLTPGIIDELHGRMSSFPDVKSGVFIPEVVFNSPSHRAGIYPGDVIVSINGTKVTDAKQVYEFVAKGDLLTIEIFRGLEKLRVMVKPETIP